MNTVPKLQNKSFRTFLSDYEPKPSKGSKLPLLERLIDKAPGNTDEHPQKNFLNRAQVLESIINEISCLLNSRLSATAKTYSSYTNQEYGLGLPWMYGIPDFTSFDPSNKTLWPKINDLIKNAISYFEPRLQKIKVSIDHFDNQNQRLYLSISGNVVMKAFQQPVSFGIEINNIT